MDDALNNPILILFLSFTIGALVNVVMMKTKFYDRLTRLNFISDRMSERIGVLVVRKLMTDTILGKFNNKLHYSGKHKVEQLKSLRQEMTGAEIGHLIGFIVILIVCFVYFLYDKNAWLILGLLILNLFFNLYLVFLQQYNKRRIDRILRRAQKK